MGLFKSLCSLFFLLRTILPSIMCDLNFHALFNDDSLPVLFGGCIFVVVDVSIVRYLSITCIEFERLAEKAHKVYSCNTK